MGLHKSTQLSQLLICAAALGFCSSLMPPSRFCAHAAPQRPVLQAISTTTTSYSSHKYLYLRVFEDGTVEYHNILDVDLTKPIPIVAKTIAHEEVEKLLALLLVPSVQQLSGAFEREDMGVVRETLDVEIHRNVGTQKVILMNFHSNSDVPGHPGYPEAAVRLGCMVDRIEQKAKSRDWQSEECKNLSKTD